MPFVNGAELDGLRADAARAQKLEGEVRTLHDRVDSLRAVGRVAQHAEGEIALLEESGALLSDAENMARVTVTQATRERLTNELADGLLADRSDEFADEYRREHGPGIRDELDELFRTDGTYDRVCEAAKADVRAEIHDQLVGEVRAKVDAELDTPETKARFIDEVRDEIQGSDELEEYRVHRRAELEDGWRTEAVEKAKRQVDAEEGARETEFTAAYATEYLESYEGRRRRENTRAQLEDKWRGKTVEEINERAQDEELTALLEKRVEQEKEKLRKQNLSEGLLAEFEGEGIDMTKIEKGLRVVVYLGGVTKREKNRWTGNGYDTTEGGFVVDTKRKLVFTSRGGGKFVVVSDTLGDSDNEYVRNDALTPRTVVALGSVIHENGTEAFESRVVADAELVIDTNTEDPSVTKAFHDVANVEVDGTSARQVELYKDIA